MRPLDLYEKDSSKKVTIYFEGKSLEAYEGEPIHVALLANGIKWITLSGHGRKRGAFTFGPVLVTVNGVRNYDGRKTKVWDGMKIEMQSYMEPLPEHLGEMGKVERYYTDVVIVGSGAAGLGAALEMQDSLDVMIFEEKGRLGWGLLKRSVPLSNSKKPKEFRKELVERLRVKAFTRTPVLGVFRDGDYFIVVANKEKDLIEVTAKRVVVSTGGIAKFALFENNEMPGVFREDFVLELLNIWGVKPGNKITLYGSNSQNIAREFENHGLNYILIENPIVRAEGKNEVERVVDAKGNVYETDALIIAEGYRPDIHLAQQVGAEITYVEDLGGYLPLRNKRNEIVDGVYIAGNASWIKGSYENYLEGRLVGAYILEEFGFKSNVDQIKEEFLKKIGNKASLLEEVIL
ncbi:FAD-dependent oxidoreductase [Thermococcus barophilus]|uniref:Sarcosine oxidase n=1 Tax=Thermococcus barophilus (strain DSM 11836 / MP) TaxID=391623 RepID=F0LMH5_THEBM|nr:FAD-dependent oxidoreductase [Thermococcus barophilus]ADT83954.1 sarcosine oxidase [Thermococcus barophilus MP]